MADKNETLRFAEIVLGAEVVYGEPPAGSFLSDLRRLVKLRDAGEISEGEMTAELERLHPRS